MLIPAPLGYPGGASSISLGWAPLPGLLAILILVAECGVMSPTSCITRERYTHYKPNLAIGFYHHFPPSSPLNPLIIHKHKLPSLKFGCATVGYFGYRLAVLWTLPPASCSHSSLASPYRLGGDFVQQSFSTIRSRRQMGCDTLVVP